MRKQYYECHITMEGNKDMIKEEVEGMADWKFSAIDGDPILGEGVKCYATRHFNYRWEHLSVQMAIDTTVEYLKIRGVKVLRRKVELVLYDVKE